MVALVQAQIAMFEKNIRSQRQRGPDFWIWRLGASMDDASGAGACIPAWFLPQASNSGPQNQGPQETPGSRKPSLARQSRRETKPGASLVNTPCSGQTAVDGSVRVWICGQWTPGRWALDCGLSGVRLLRPSTLAHSYSTLLSSPPSLSLTTSVHPRPADSCLPRCWIPLPVFLSFSRLCIPSPCTVVAPRFP